jgi:Nuclease-related domain
MPDHVYDAGTAGASARERAEEIRELRSRADAHAGGSGAARFLRFLAGPSQAERRLIADERRWRTGARGEELLAEALARRCPQATILHDRRIPRSVANIDHLAITPSGVYVIDAKRYRGNITVEKPLFGSAKLMVAGRDRTGLIAGLEKQVAVVRAALLAHADDVPVHGCLCFVAPEGLLADVGLPLIRTLHINGYPLYYSRRLARRLNRPGPLSPERARELRNELCARLPPATRAHRP